MADSRHIENRFFAYISIIFVRFTRNLVARSIITFRHRSCDQNTKFRKFKMADGCHFENGFIAISLPEIIRFQWNLVCRRKFCFQGRRRNIDVPKFFKIQNGGRPPYWKSFSAISQRLIVQLTRNLVGRSMITFRHGSRDQTTNFDNSR